MTQASDETRQNGAYESIGYKRKDNNNITVHIGKGLFIPETNFNIMLNSSSPSVFVRNASRVVFGEDVLLCSTVTGKHSNRSKKKGAIPAPTPLNPSGLDLIHAIEENFNAEEENSIDEEDRDNVSEKDEDNIDEDHQSIVVDEEHANDFGEKDEENSDDKYYSSDTETVLNGTNNI
ncbi:hypothetical protein PV328_011959 [Microctonus aethiopoides]|uniref:Uncharacterized protein n=1 Tax=Microctonus aethiopoides TaxID=144406 RepID=A0AA39FH58_9HYME|nr:hypothetical protein PV328_011959 [Microctonus aethiopoides]